MKRISVLDLRKLKADNQPIVMVTAYDATMARLVDLAGVDMVLEDQDCLICVIVVLLLPYEFSIVLGSIFVHFR